MPRWYGSISEWECCLAPWHSWRPDLFEQWATRLRISKISPCSSATNYENFMLCRWNRRFQLLSHESDLSQSSVANRERAVKLALHSHHRQWLVVEANWAWYPVWICCLLDRPLLVNVWNTCRDGGPHSYYGIWFGGWIRTVPSDGPSVMARWIWVLMLIISILSNCLASRRPWETTYKRTVILSTVNQRRIKPIRMAVYTSWTLWIAVVVM